MDQVFELLLQFLTQFAGGPGPAENNLVRFALPAAFWGILLFVAWSRQKQDQHPREKWLVWGFALCMFRELFLLTHLAIKMVNQTEHDAFCNYVEPIEHTLSLAAIAVIAGAFLRYILDDVTLSSRYLRAGIIATAFGGLVTIIWWPNQLAANPQARFHDAGSAVLLHLLSLALLATAIIILVRNRGWLRNIIIVALSFLFVAEFIVLFNFWTDRVYVEVLCPIGNSFHILAVPLFGLVYFREMSLEKNKAQRALSKYRDHLEELVHIRTRELTAANKQLERAAVLEERQRIAAEMHDGLAQTLSFLGMKTDIVVEMLNDGQASGVLEEIDQMHLAIGQATTDVRRSIASLRENPRQRGSLDEEISRLCDSFTASSGKTVRFQNDLPATLYITPEELEQVSKVVQEALLNIYQHANAPHTEIRITNVKNMVKITIRDDGQGFETDEQEKASGDHFGLSIMKARATRIGGKLTIRSQPGNGTVVTLVWVSNYARDALKSEGEQSSFEYGSTILSLNSDLSK